MRREDFERAFMRSALTQESRPIFHCTLTIYRRRRIRDVAALREMALYRVHRALFRSSRFAGVPTHELLHGFSAIELTTSPHLHLVVGVARGYEESFAHRLSKTWARLAPAGDTVCVRHGRTLAEVDVLARYLSKEMHNAELRDAFACTCELMPRVAGPLAALARELRTPAICPLCQQAAIQCASLKNPQTVNQIFDNKHQR